MKIKVEQKHIYQGKRGNCFDCPIALAIKEQYPHTLVVAIQYGYIKVDGALYQSTPEMDNFVDNFDKWNPVQPFETEVFPE